MRQAKMMNEGASAMRHDSQQATSTTGLGIVGVSGEAPLLDPASLLENSGPGSALEVQARIA